MHIETTRNGGFCFGVRRAVEAVEQCIAQGGPVYTLGPIIHNPQVVDHLAEMGVRVIDRIEDVEEGTVVIRSHGVPPDVYEEASRRGIRLVDATCPFVRRIQQKVHASHEEGRPVIILGEPSHPEIIGVNGWCGGQAHIVRSAQDVEALPPLEDACVVAQTTLPQAMWDELVPLICERVKGCQVFPSICSATSDRQRETAQLAARSDAMVVIGGRNSSNTRKLYDICRQHCPRVWLVETARDIPVKELAGCRTVGVTSGASTPDWIIKEVCKTMSDIENKELIFDDDQAPATAPGEGTSHNDGLNGAVTAASDEPAGQAESAPQAEAQTIPENDNAAPAPEAEAGPAEPAAASAPEAEVPSAASQPPKKLTADERFMEDLEKTLVTIRNGQIIKGKVVSVNENEVCVNIGYKSDGFISRSEFSASGTENPMDVVKEGDEIEVEVLRVNDGDGNVVLSKKSADAKRHWKEILDEYESGKVFIGVGRQAVKGGLICNIHGVRAFVPASHLDVRYVNDVEEFVGKELKLKILEVEKQRHRVVASRKQVLLDEENERKNAKWDALQEGARVKGVVRRLTDFGAFVDIGGLDGLIHVTDLAWGRVQHPKDVVSIGEEVDVQILKVDRKRERISLGLKQVRPKPWEVANAKYVEGDIVRGKVVRIVSFGAFVELEPGLDGLVHISQIANHRVDKVEDALQVGQEVNVRILSVNPEQRRISLSIRDAQADASEIYEQADDYSAPVYSTSAEDEYSPEDSADYQE